MGIYNLWQPLGSSYFLYWLYDQVITPCPYFLRDYMTGKHYHRVAN